MSGLAAKAFQTQAGRTLLLTAIGTGCAPLGNLYAPIEEATAQETLASAYAAGSRYFDVAPSYGLGLAERRLGTFLRTARPDDVTLSSKAGRLLKRGPRGPNSQPEQWHDVPERDIDFDYSYDGIMRSYEFSLERLGVDKIDILYCHDIDEMTHGSVEASRERAREFLDGGHSAMVELREAGAIDAFGLGVNTWQICQFIGQRAELDLFLLAGRYTLLEQEALETMLPMCEQKGIGVVIGGPYNSGILATGAKPGARYDYAPATDAILTRVAAIEAVCARYGVRLRDAAIRFPLAHPSVVSIIPGGVSPEEIAQTIDALEAAIPSDFWQALKDQGLVRQDAPVPLEV